MKLSKAERALLAKLGRLGGLKGGRKGGKALAGRGAREAWAKIPLLERSTIMRQRAAVRERRRKALAKKLAK
jgi:hypothetical protein